MLAQARGASLAPPSVLSELGGRGRLRMRGLVALLLPLVSESSRAHNHIVVGSSCSFEVLAGPLLAVPALN